MKKPTVIKLTDDAKKEMKKRYGTLQNFIDRVLEKEGISNDPDTIDSVD